MNEDVIDLMSSDDDHRSTRTNNGRQATTKKPGPKSKTVDKFYDVDDDDDDEVEEIDSGSDSDFDDDPDYMEVPGGGKSLQSIVPKQSKTTGTATATSSTAGNIKTQNKMLVDLIEKGSLPSSSSLASAAASQSSLTNSAQKSNLAAQLFNFQKNDKTKKGNVQTTGGLGLKQHLQQPFPTQTNATVNQMLPNFMNASSLMPPITVPAGVDPKLIFNQLRSALGMSAKNPHLMNAFTDVMKSAVVTATGPSTMPAASLNMAALWQNLNAASQMSNFAYSKMGANARAGAMADGGQQAEDEEDDEEMGVAETYADYKPAKLNLKWYMKHPDPVVETASLSSVEPADVTYTLSLPDETIRSGALSALQLEAITYAAQKHESFLPDGSRAGFLIGDGAGVGKGRTIAGLIFENYQKKRKRSIWVSVSNDLKYDAERDLGDIGAGKIQVYPLNKLKYAKISAPINGTIKKGVIFSTYSSLIGESTNVNGKFKSRLNMLIQWFGEDFDGLIVFDECHRAKNLCPVGSSKPTKTGLTVLELQNRLPKARIVYASATGASEPKNMAYMVRLGMWGMGTPFKEFTDFISTVEKRGVGAMEIVAMDMKLRGMYIARQLSFQGVTFRVENVPLTKEFIRMYDDSVKLWVDLLTKFQEAAGLIGSEGRLRKTIFSQFWSSHQRFFKYLCIAAKVPMAVDIAQESVKCGQCVVIGLQSTGEARTLEQLEREDGELNDFVSTAKGVLQSLIEQHFPAPTRRHLDRIYGAQKLPTKNGSSSTAAVANTGERKMRKRKAAASSNAVLEKSRKRVKRVTSDNDDDDDDQVSDDSVHIVSSGSEYHDTDDDNRKNGRTRSSKRKTKNNSSSDDNSDDDDDDDDSDEDSDDEELESDEETLVSSDSFVVSDSYDSDSDMSGSDTKPRPKKRKALNKKKGDDKFYEHLLEKKRSLAKAGITGSTRDLSIGALANNTVYLPSREAVQRACQMRDELLERVERLGKRLPPNTLDELIDNLGGTENVAEMTGRKGRVVNTGDGVQYESRAENDVPLETLNIAEKQRFMNNEKDVAIISEAASSGISLQSDRRCKNQRRRVHITLELPWSADRAIQQFGRTHRSNQVNAPEYIFMISELAGEKRFASTVAKRLESLGALTHGDRRATKTRDLSQFNIDNKYGRQALETVMKSIMGYDNAMVKPPDDYKGDFFKDVADALVGVGLITNSETMPGTLSLDKEYNNISKFLNRILGVTVELQNRLFKYFQDTLNAIIMKERRLGRFDLGILDLGTSGEEVRRIKLYKFLRKHSTGIAPTELHIVQVERGMSWAQALEKESTLVGAHEGFYLSHQIRNNKKTAILAVLSESPSSIVGSSNPNKQSYYIYRPNTGLQVRQETFKELQSKYRKVEPDEAQQPWTGQYESAATTCSHAYWRGNCRAMTVMQSCEPAHVKACFLGSSLTIPISDGKLNLGTWQGIWLCEHRNQAGSRKLIVTLNGCLKPAAAAAAINTSSIRSPLSPTSPPPSSGS